MSSQSHSNRRASKALVIAPQPFFTPRGTPISVYYRTLYTANEGVAIDLLTYGRGLDVEIPNVRIIRIPGLAWLGDVPVGPSFAKLIMDVFLFIWTISLLLFNRYDFVHAHEEAIFFLPILKPIFGFRLVYDMHSSLPQQLTNFRFTRSKAVVTAFRWLELVSLRCSDVVITICPDLAEYAEARMPDKRRHLLIENTVFDTINLAELDKLTDRGADYVSTEKMLPPHSSNRRLVVYAGTLEVYQGIDILLNAFRIVLRGCPDAFLIIVGGAAKQVEAYERIGREYGLSEACHFTGSVPPHRSRQISQHATVHVSPRTVGSNTPSKVYEQLASGIPIVATDIRAHTQILDDSIAFLARPDADSIADALMTAITDDGQRKRRTIAARCRYEERYFRQNYVAKIRELVDRVS